MWESESVVGYYVEYEGNFVLFHFGFCVSFSASPSKDKKKFQDFCNGNCVPSSVARRVG